MNVPILIADVEKHGNHLENWVEEFVSSVTSLISASGGGIHPQLVSRCVDLSLDRSFLVNWADVWWEYFPRTIRILHAKNKSCMHGFLEQMQMEYD